MKIFFDYYRKEWINKFENKMLYYNIIPKECRSNTSLENYNKYIKDNLSNKKCVHWINLLSFMKREEQRITDKITHEEKSPTNKYIMNDNCNIERN